MCWLVLWCCLVCGCRFIRLLVFKWCCFMIGLYRFCKRVWWCMLWLRLLMFCCCRKCRVWLVNLFKIVLGGWVLGNFVVLVGLVVLVRLVERVGMVD